MHLPLWSLLVLASLPGLLLAVCLRRGRVDNPAAALREGLGSLERNLLGAQRELERAQEVKSGQLRQELAGELVTNRRELQSALISATASLESRLVSMDQRVEKRLGEMAAGVQNKLEQNIKEGFVHF